MGYLGPNPSPVSSGGTGASTLTGVLTGNGTSAMTAGAVTQYGTLIGGASNSVVSTSAGSVSQILLSNGASSNPSFQASGGSLVLLNSQTVASVASVDFVSLITSTYNNYALRYYQGAPGTSLSALVIRYSINNGSSFISSSYLGGNIQNAYSSSTLTNNSSSSYNRLTGAENNGLNTKSAGWVYIMNVQSGSRPVMVGLVNCNSTTSFFSCRVTGTNSANTSINAIQVFSSGGGVLSGTYDLFGMKES